MVSQLKVGKPRIREDFFSTPGPFQIGTTNWDSTLHSASCLASANCACTRSAVSASVEIFRHIATHRPWSVGSNLSVSKASNVISRDRAWVTRQKRSEISEIYDDVLTRHVISMFATKGGRPALYLTSRSDILCRAGNWHLTLAPFLLVVLGSAGRTGRNGEDVGKVERGDKKRGRGRERWIKRSRKYRRGGYTARINSRSHENALFHVRCLVLCHPLRARHEIVCTKASAIVFRYLVANPTPNIGLSITRGWTGKITSVRRLTCVRQSIRTTSVSLLQISTQLYCAEMTMRSIINI